jgi:hypothetical protein
MALTATAIGSESQRARSGVRRAEFRAALEQALSDADADQRIGPAIGATNLRVRFEFTDCDLALNVAAAECHGNLTWSFDRDPGWAPKLVLEMDSAVANRYLQGRESLAIAIARGQVRVSGESRVALLYLPATRLLGDAYRRAVEADFPELVASSERD